MAFRSIIGMRNHKFVQATLFRLDAGQIRPYAYALLMTGGAGGLLRLADQVLVRYSLPWALISLLVVATAVGLCGVGPALMVLTITALFGDVIAPDLHISYFNGQVEPWSFHVIRMSLYMFCGVTIIVLAHQAETMRQKTERKRGALHAMQAMAAPTTLATVEGWQVASLYKPARADEEVGGDFYDFFTIEGNEPKFGVLVGDVMGKGKEAAVHTAMLRYTVRALAHLGFSPGEVMHRLNSQVDADVNAPTASLFFGRMDTASGVMEYASAGHEPPLVFRCSGEVESLYPTGPLVGVDTHVAYDQRHVEVAPGDKLLFMTDGVTEARSPAGNFLDSDGVVQLFMQSKGDDPPRILTRFVDLVMDFAEGDNRDDIAILLLQREALRMPIPVPAEPVEPSCRLGAIPPRQAAA